MSDPNRALSEVPALLEERRKYEAWIAALEARRESTQPHVFQRVHEDYRGRLKRVEEQLAGLREALEAERERIASRVELIQRDEQARNDERAELDLRVQVGELTAEHASSAFRSLDETLQQLTTERARMEGQLAALAKLISGPTQGSSASTATAGRERAKSGSADGTFDELAFLSSIVEADRSRPNAAPPAPAPRPAAPAQPAPPPAAPPPQAARLSDVQERDLETLAPREEGGAALLSGISGAAPTATHESTASESMLRDLDSGAASHRADTPPLAGKRQAPGAAPLTNRQTVTADQPKTLKCTECGSMNYPTEWYCERCGAELAAL